VYKNIKKIMISVLAIILIIVSVILLNNDPVVPIGLPGHLFTEAAHTERDGSQADDESDGETINDILIISSHPAHFYDSEIHVSLFASSTEAAIFYTLDGSEPTTGSEAFLEPIHINTMRRNEVNVVTIKAIAMEDGRQSRMFVHTYFVGTNIFNRFDTLIFSLSTDADYLFDYETGIFVEGITRDEFIREMRRWPRNQRRDIIPPDPANFNWRGPEAERPVYVEVFESGGERVIAQAAGMRVQGGWSRAVDQKSIRLVARNAYEPGGGRFRYEFFPGNTVLDGFDTPIRRYDQLILRNKANDRDFGMIRNEVGLELARMAGLEVVSPVRPVVIFLNGEYYGFSWMHVRINAHYLQDRFNAPTREFQVVGRGEYWIDSDDPDEQNAIEYFNSFYTKDLTDEAIFAEFKEIVDIDQVILYYAVQSFLGNHDWPGNNIRRWRYIGPQEDGLAPELDGRWRYVVYDLDWILGLYEDPPDPNRPTFQQMTDPDNGRFSHMLNALFKRPDMVDYFAMVMCDLAANVITPQNVSDLIDELFGASQNEIRHALAANNYSHWVSLNTVTGNHQNMLIVADGLSEYIFRSLREHFGWDEGMFTISVTGADAYIGTQKGRSAQYFDRLTVPLKPALPENTLFDHWIVGGTVIDTPEITVSASDAVDGIVNVELVTREHIPFLMFREAYENDADHNGCVLYNPGSEAVTIRGFYMTNDRENLFRWAIPDASIEPGGVLEFAGRGSNASDDIHKIRMGFNVRQGRNLYLVNATGEIITHITVR